MHTNKKESPFRTGDSPKGTPIQRNQDTIDTAIECFMELKKYDKAKENIINHINVVFGEHRYSYSCEEKAAHLLIQNLLLGFIETLDL